MTDGSLLLPIGPTARRLRVPIKWLRDEATLGRIPHVRAGRVMLFNLETVERLLLERAAREGLQCAPA